ncbi:hypothetical protein F5Y17DRAFT_436373 [Xylariaceae sp. FL0594]|nr:hypothetical protein F5Y17DRAFT_436373 [Xylariaceae sp. FL0594]
MASPMLKSPNAGSGAVTYDENVQQTTTYPAYPWRNEDKQQKEINPDLLTIDPSHRFNPTVFSPYHQAGRAASPISLQNLLLPPATISISDHASVPAVLVRKGFRGFCSTQWSKHKAPILVFVAQLFGALMNLGARLLELGEVGTKLHPMQLLFSRMLLTALACTAYIYRRRIPHGVLGDPEVRWLLVARSIVGFFGIYGMWYSIKYLPLAEATVIQFLIPTLSGFWCHIFLGDPYTRTEKLASFLALAGVVFVTKPATLFASSDLGDQVAGSAGPDVTAPYATTASERLGAVAVALLGVLGGSFAYTTLRAIGKRAHSFVSVNYFSSACVLVTFTVLSLSPLLNIGQPELQLALPSSIRQWGLLLFITACGLIMQVLMTQGLAAERSNRATAMTYTNILFAAGFDRLVWGTSLDWVSATGCAMIIAGALWAAIGKKAAAVGDERKNVDGDVESAIASASAGAEGVPMLSGREEEGDDEGVPDNQTRR